MTVDGRLVRIRILRMGCRNHRGSWVLAEECEEDRVYARPGSAIN